MVWLALWKAALLHGLWPCAGAFTLRTNPAEGTRWRMWLSTAWPRSRRDLQWLGWINCCISHKNFGIPKANWVGDGLLLPPARAIVSTPRCRGRRAAAFLRPLPGGAAASLPHAERASPLHAKCHFPFQNCAFEPKHLPQTFGTNTALGQALGFLAGPRDFCARIKTRAPS